MGVAGGVGWGIGAVPAGAELFRPGVSTWGRVARSRAAASVGKNRPPFCPQAVNTTTLAAAMPSQLLVWPRGLPTIEVFDPID